MLTLNLAQAIAEGGEEVFVGRHNRPIHVEFDNGLGFFDGRDDCLEAEQLGVRGAVGGGGRPVCLGGGGRAVCLGGVIFFGEAVGPRGGCWINHGFWF